MNLTTAGLRSAALVASVLLPLGACSAGSHEDQVASIATPRAPGPTDPTAAGSSSQQGTPTPNGSQGSQRPQLRLDDPPGRSASLILAWKQCLLANGARGGPGAGPGAAGPGGQTDLVVLDPVPPRASSACQDQLPLQPPELDPSVNPRYRDDFVAMVSCMKAQGMQIHITEDDSAGQNALGWTYDTGASAGGTQQIERQCQLQAFGGTSR